MTSVLPFYLLPNLDFFDLINNNQFNNNDINRHSMFTLDQLNDMKFDLGLNDHNRYLNDNDPDLNFLNNLDPIEVNNATYIYDDQLQNLSELNSSNFSVMTYNISSLPKNFDYLADVILHNSNLDIVGLCETRLSPDIDQLYGLKDYSLYANDRSRNGGGVALYVSNKNVGHFARDDLTYMHESIETVAIEIPGSTKNSVVLMVYRKPSGDFNQFLSVMSDILDKMGGTG